MTAISKKEALAAVNAARTKAQHAHEKMGSPADQVDQDALKLHYQRCVRDLEAAINDAAPYETSGDE